MSSSSSSTIKEQKTLRIAASNVAALAGLHPYKDLPQLTLDLVYQGLPVGAMKQDATALGVTLVSEMEIITQLAAKAGVKRAAEAAFAIQDGIASVTSVQEATAIKHAVVKGATGKLSTTELAKLTEATRSAVDTGFGCHHEADALDRLAQLTCTEVRNRNADMMVWPFRRHTTDIGVETVIAMKAAQPHARRHHHHHTQKATKNTSEVNHKQNMEVIEISDDTPQGKNHSKTDLVKYDTLDDLSGSNKDESIHNDTSSKNDQQAQDTKLSVHCSVPSVEKKCIETDMKKSTMDRVSNHCVVMVEASTSLGTQVGSCTSDSDPSNKSSPDTVIEIDTSADNEHQTDETETPLFHIVGSVDGIREEIVSLGEKDDDSWHVETMVVEVKHRMRRVHAVPPLYEQVQAVVYALMYNVGATEIVQVLRTAPVKSKDNAKGSRKVTAKPKENEDLSKNQTLDSWLKQPTIQDISDEKTKDDSDSKPKPPSSFTITVSKVRVDDPVMRHRQSWTEIILPRLRSFADAILRIRSDDNKRYRLLLAVGDHTGCGSLQAWELLHEELPWLRKCDTAFHRVPKE